MFKILEHLPYSKYAVYFRLSSLFSPILIVSGDDGEFRLRKISLTHTNQLKLRLS